MMRSKLTVCSSLLYHWIRLHQNSKRAVPFNPSNFQAWTGEFLERSVSLDEVEIALMQLTQLNLIANHGKVVRLKEEASRARLIVPPLPKLLVKGRSRKSWLITSLLVTGLLAVWGGAVAIHNQSSSTTSPAEKSSPVSESIDTGTLKTEPPQPTEDSEK